MSSQQSRAAAIDAAGQILATTLVTVSQMTPRQQAEAAWEPYYDMTVDELEDEIRADRGLSPVERGGVA